jgi:hypothetical protein
MEHWRRHATYRFLRPSLPQKGTAKLDFLVRSLNGDMKVVEVAGTLVESRVNCDHMDTFRNSSVGLFSAPKTFAGIGTTVFSSVTENIV